MRPVRMGVLGCASIARRRMLPAMAACATTEVVAVASRDPAIARAVADTWDCVPVTGYDSLLQRDDVDAVYVPLPLALHARWVEAALLAGKHVLAEKPLTTDPRVTAALLALARRRGLVLAENVLFPQHRQHAMVRRMLADGVVGEVLGVRAEFTIPPPAEGDIRYRADLDGGALADIGIYPVRTALLLLGLDLTVAGCVLRTAPGREVVTSGAALLRDPDGRTAQLLFGMEHGYAARYEVQGTAGRLAVDRAFTPPADHVPVVTLTHRNGVTEVASEADDQVRRTVAAFAAAVRRAAGEPVGPDEPPPLADSQRPETCLRQAELLDQMARLGAAGAVEVAHR